LRQKVVRAVALVLAIPAALMTFLIWETTIAGIPASLVEQYTFLKSIPAGWWPIIAMFALVLFLFALALGPDRLQAWWTWRRNLLASQRADTEGARELEPQERQSAQDALERYLDRMERWITDEENPLASLPYDHPHRKWAATHAGVGSLMEDGRMLV